MPFEGNMGKRNLILLLESHPDLSVPLTREQRQELIRKLRRLEELEGEKRALQGENRALGERARQLAEEDRRLREELRRLKTSAPFLAASGRTAEAGGMPSSKTLYRRPTGRGRPRSTGGQPGHRGFGRRRPTPNAPSVRVGLALCPRCSTKLGGPCDLNGVEMSHLQSWIAG